MHTFIFQLLQLNPADGMYVCLLRLYAVLSCVGRGLWDGLITHPEKSYRVSKYVIKKPQYRGGKDSSMVCSE
jgi:hypothetical protein